ncbi:MAG: MFS transporter [Acidobacteriota bacterium]
MKVTLAQRLRRFPLWRPLAQRDFRLLFVGQSVSLFGDQFYLVALTWLTLQLTGSGLALGTVLMVGGGARGVFQLVGGALSDRMSQRTILLISNIVRALVSALLTAVVFLGITRLWHLIVLSLLFGIVDAFFQPAFLAFVPRLIDRNQLTAGSALMRGSSRLMGMVGPAAAGLVLYRVGMASAFALDTATFVFAASTVWLMRKPRLPASSDRELKEEETSTLKGLLGSIREGLKYAWSDPLLRTLLIFITAVEFSFVGASGVGLAVLAKDRFGGGDAASEGGAAFATILAAMGAGAWIGMIVAGSIEAPKRKGRLVVGLSFMMGAGLAVVGVAPNVVTASIVFGFVGLGGGMANIIILAWMQARTDPQMLGRVMALAMFMVSVIEPLSLALAGLIADYNVTLMFAAAGGVLLATSALSLASRTLLTSD